MHILFLTQILPYPPDSGPKVKTWNVLKFLSQKGFRITLISFVRAEELPFVDEVRKVCSKVHIIPLKRSRIADVVYFLRSQITNRPFLVERDDSKKMRSLVNDIITSGPIDLIHADQLTMAQFALPYVGKENPVLLFDAHNAVWTIVDRMKDSAPFYLKLALILEAKRVKKYEARIVKDFNHTLAVSEVDRKALIEAVNEYEPEVSGHELPIRVIPIAVDTKLLQPARRTRGSKNIFTMGTLYYPPNADGIRWFIHDVFPLIQKSLHDVRLTIVGKNPPEDFIKLARNSNGVIEVTGYVSDLDPYFNQSALIVIPVRAGGGIRVRILEAFARAMPVVTTTVGLEGIEAEVGEDVLVADKPDEFSASVIRLLKDLDFQDSLAAKGRRLAVEKYDWQVVLNQLKDVYQKKE